MKKILLLITVATALACAPTKREITRDDLVHFNVQGTDGGLAREIFVVDSRKLEGSGDIEATLVFWLLAPPNRVKPNPTASAGIPPSTAVDATNGVSWGYTAAELTAIRTGTTLVQTTTLAQGEVTGDAGALANFRAAADTKYATAQAALNTSSLGIKSIGMARQDGVWGAAP